MISRAQEFGFTLLEVLAALAIAATGLLAVSQTIISSLSVSEETESRTVAYWVAGNHLSDLRLSGIWPAQGTSQAEVSMGRRKWRVQQVIKSTADADVQRVELAVFLPSNADRRLAALNGYLVRIDPPRERNNDGG